MRRTHAPATDWLTGPYTGEESWNDLLQVTGGWTDETLARMMIEHSEAKLWWDTPTASMARPGIPNRRAPGGGGPFDGRRAGAPGFRAA